MFFIIRMLLLTIIGLTVSTFSIFIVINILISETPEIANIIFGSYYSIYNLLTLSLAIMLYILARNKENALLSAKAQEELMNLKDDYSEFLKNEV